MVSYFLAIFIAFFSRKIFLDKLGAEFIGLTTTANSLLGFLNLAELGVGTSIAYFCISLYLKTIGKRSMIPFL